MPKLGWQGGCGGLKAGPLAAAIESQSTCEAPGAMWPSTISRAPAAEASASCASNQASCSAADRHDDESDCGARRRAVWKLGKGEWNGKEQEKGEGRDR